VTSSEKSLPSVGPKELIESNRANNWPDLSARDKVIANEFAVAGNIADAANKANVSKAVAYKAIRSPLGAAYLDDLMRDMREDSILTRPFIELQLLETLEQANGDVEVHILNDGVPQEVRLTDLRAKLQVIKQMQTMGGFDKGTQGSDKGGVHVHFDLSKFGVEQPQEKEINRDNFIEGEYSAS
jgi:hypothetical protein